jgi:hypothetical protein
VSYELARTLWAREWSDAENSPLSKFRLGPGDDPGEPMFSDYVAELILLADVGDLDAAITLLSFVLIALGDQTLHVPPNLKEWFGRFCRAVEDNPKQTVSAALTRRHGGRPPHTRTVREAFDRLKVKRTACLTVDSLVKAGWHVTAACEEVAGIMEERRLIDPIDDNLASRIQRWRSDRSSFDPSS